MQELNSVVSSLDPGFVRVSGVTGLSFDNTTVVAFDTDATDVHALCERSLVKSWVLTQR